MLGRDKAGCLTLPLIAVVAIVVAGVVQPMLAGAKEIMKLDDVAIVTQCIVLAFTGAVAQYSWFYR